MKIIYLFTSFCPLKKCGIDPASASLAAAGGSLFGNILSSESSSENVSSQIRAQKEENQLNRDWQTAEAEKARQAQSQLSYGLQAEQARLQSPVYQSQQLKKAGLNPQVYFGQSSSFSGSSAPAAGASGVGSVGGLSPVSYQPPNLNIADILSSVGSAIKSSAEAKKLGIESDWLPKQLLEQLRNVKSDTDLKTLFGLGQKIHNELENANVPYAIRMAEGRLYKLLSEVDLNKQNALTSESQVKLNSALEGVQNSIRSLTDKEVEKMGLEMPLYLSYLKAQINNLTAGAHESESRAKTEDEFRATRGAILGLDYALKHNEVEISNSTVKAAIESALQHAVQERWHTKEAYIDFFTKKYKLDTQGVKDAMNLITGWIPFAPGVK